METFQCLEKISELKNILDQVSFTLYFQPNNAINTPGVERIDDLATEIQSLVSIISNPPTPTPS